MRPEPGSVTVAGWPTIGSPARRGVTLLVAWAAAGACDAAPPDAVPVPDRPLFESVVEGPVPSGPGRSRGAAFGDVDGDGDPDLLVTRAAGDASEAPAENVLFLNDGSGGFARVDSVPTGIEAGGSEGAAWIDADGDGDLDLHVVGRSGVGSTLYRNDAGRLIPVPDPFEGAVRQASMACWIDVDLDARLDAFIVGYRSHGNRLFRNLGGWRFDAVPLPDGAEGSGAGRACAAGDIDGDGLPEIFVANASAPNTVIRATRSGDASNLSFRADTAGPFVGDANYGYGLSWTDVNDDGLRDLFLANFDAPNALFLGTGSGELVPSPLGATLESAASKGHAWGDFDLDGRVDLYLGSGTPGPGQWNRLYLGQAGGGFVSYEEGPIGVHADTSAAVAAADIDLDGDLDVFVANWGSAGSPDRLYSNTTPPGRWIKVVLEGTRSNRMGVGARVTLVLTESGTTRHIHRWLDAATGYAGQNEPIVHFGLGTAEIDSVLVSWPSGAVDRRGDVEAGRTITMREST